MIQHAKIVSQISKRLMSARAFPQPTDMLLANLHELETQLRSWRDSLPQDIRPPDSMKHFRLPKVERPLPVLFIQNAYYGSLLNIHCVLTYPWIKQVLPNSPQPVPDGEILRSAETAASAARSLVLIASRLEINAASHQW